MNEKCSVEATRDESTPQ